MLDEHVFLFSEINELKELLETLPADNVIERISLESLLVKAQQALAELIKQTKRASSQ